MDTCIKDKLIILANGSDISKFINFKVGKIPSTNLNIPTYVADSFDRTVQNNFRCVWQDEFLKTLVRNAELRVKASEKYTEVLNAKGSKKEAEEIIIKYNRPSNLDKDPHTGKKNVRTKNK